MRLLLLLLLAGLASAHYAEPPLTEVVSGNQQLAPSLRSIYDPSIALNSTVVIELGSFSRQLEASSSIEILSLSPTIDGIACARSGMAVLSVRGWEMEELMALPSEGWGDFACDQEWFYGTPEYAWRCDFDGDTCVEYVISREVDYSGLEARFAFGELSAAVPFSSTILPVPPEIVEAMAYASGNDTLTVEISGDLLFIYIVNDGISGFGACSDSILNFNSSVPVSLNRSFPVGGSQKLFFLAAPVLREQWHMDNRFDVVVLSQCPLYKVEISKNGNLSESASLRTFSIEAGRHGVLGMVSNMSDADGWYEGSSAVASPLQLGHGNVSYLFAYRFNHSYAGLGENNLSIKVYDAGLHEASYSEVLVSRMLSYRGTHAEDGSPYGSVPSRPSLAPQVHSPVRIEMAIGLIALVLIAAFVNSWLLGKT